MLVGPGEVRQDTSDRVQTVHELERGRAQGEPCVGMRPPPGLAHSPQRDRVRRSSDLLLAVFSLIFIVVVLISIRTLPTGSTELSNDVSLWLRQIPRWLSSGAEVVAALGCIAVVIVGSIALVRNDIRSAVNARYAARLLRRLRRSLPPASGMARTVRSRSRSSIAAIRSSLSSIPPSVALLVASDLARRSWWTKWYLLSGAGLLLAGLAVNSLTPFAVVIVLFGGLLFGWGVRWLLGAPSVRPSIPELINWLSEYRLSVSTLEETDNDVSHLIGSLSDGTSIEIRMANRDTRGSGLVRRLWAQVRLRHVVVGHVALSFRSQLEQLALASLIAHDGGILCPKCSC